MLLTLVVIGAGCGGASSKDGPLCCPRDPEMSGCLHLGGANVSGCFKTCDFYCSTNWRVELDEQGCSVWRYDHRAPAPGETLACQPDRDGGREASTTD
jgi:hypothetical protein